MNLDWIIIDGYNLLHKTEELLGLVQSDLQQARHKLVRLVENPAHEMAQQTTLVFDGKEAGSDEALTTRHIEVFFSPTNLSADSVIERLVCKYPHPEKILVVTSDHAERDTVSSAGAQLMSSEEFLARCRAHGKKKTAPRTPPGQQPRLGDLFPDNL